MASERVRVLRLIEYVGTREVVEQQLTTSATFPGGVGTRTFAGRDGKNLTINSVLVTQWPEVLQDAFDQERQATAEEIASLKARIRDMETLGVVGEDGEV